MILNGIFWAAEVGSTSLPLPQVKATGAGMLEPFQEWREILGMAGTINILGSGNENTRRNGNVRAITKS